MMTVLWFKIQKIIATDHVINLVENSATTKDAGFVGDIFNPIKETEIL